MQQVLEFLKDKYVMINSLMSSSERKAFHGDVSKLLVVGVEKWISDETEEES